MYWGSKYLISCIHFDNVVTYRELTTIAVPIFPLFCIIFPCLPWLAFMESVPSSPYIESTITSAHAPHVCMYTYECVCICTCFYRFLLLVVKISHQTYRPYMVCDSMPSHRQAAKVLPLESCLFRKSQLCRKT
jgi:hypothetical protein